MKKIVLVMAVLMLAAPAWAVTVDVWAQQVGNTDEVEIWYETDGNLPRAFGLNITLSEDVNIVACEPAHVGECNETDRGYGIFPGTIDISDGDVGDWGEPVAPSEDPGAEGTGLDTNEIVIELGSLYTGANTPDTSGLLCTITVSAECDVSISGNAARTGTGSGGIGVVMENPAETPTVDFTGCTVVLELCTTCRGDVDGNAWVMSDDYRDLRDALKAAPDNYFECDGSRMHACMDWDGNGWVMSDDYRDLRDALKAAPDNYYECGNEP